MILHCALVSHQLTVGILFIILWSREIMGLFLLSWYLLRRQPMVYLALRNLILSLWMLNHKVTEFVCFFLIYLQWEWVNEMSLTNKLSGELRLAIIPGNSFVFNITGIFDSREVCPSHHYQRSCQGINGHRSQANLVLPDKERCCQPWHFRQCSQKSDYCKSWKGRFENMKIITQS